MVTKKITGRGAVLSSILPRPNLGCLNMRYESVHLEAFGFALPEEVVSSEALEHRTDALYERLGLSVGRLELMSGIRTRRFWPPGTRPSAVAAAAGRDALERSGIDLGQPRWQDSPRRE